MSLSKPYIHPFNHQILFSHCHQLPQISQRIPIPSPPHQAQTPNGSILTLHRVLHHSTRHRHAVLLLHRRHLLPRPLLRRRGQHRHRPDHPRRVPHPRPLQARRVREARLLRARRPPLLIHHPLYGAQRDQDEVLHRHRRLQLRMRLVPRARAGGAGRGGGRGGGGGVLRAYLFQELSGHRRGVPSGVGGQNLRGV